FFCTALGAVQQQAATPYFDWTPTAESAYQKAIELRLAEAENLLFLMAQKEPDNYIRLLI
ncbi:MAG: hypothetical protein KDC44_08935, partial [Phaeodactylibacter sp.]|nr:hypothetical protein [Phaeodactylibacter sp.]